MKNRILTHLIIFTFISASLYAQENKTEFQKGNKAFLFSFSGLDLLGTGNFEGGIGGKLFFNRNLNLRLGIEFDFVEEDVPASKMGYKDGSKSALAFGVNIASEYHLTEGRISPYIGLGTGIRILATHSENTPNQNEKRTNLPEIIEGKNYYPGVDINLSILVGVEIFLINNLSLATEYRIGAANRTNLDGEIESLGSEVTTEGSNVFRLRIENQGWLTLAFYF